MPEIGDSNRSALFEFQCESIAGRNAGAGGAGGRGGGGGRSGQEVRDWNPEGAHG